MADLDNLIQNVQDFFQKRYGTPTGSLGPGSLFLAFEKLGTIISSGDFKLPGGTDINPALVMQHGSGIVDFVAQLDPDGFVLPRGDLSPKITDEYDALLAGANYLSQASDDPGLGGFLALQGHAKRVFDEDQASMSAFWPVNFTPQDWFNDQDPGIWSNYSYSTGAGRQPTGPPPPSGPPPVVLGDWKWRVVTPDAAPNWRTVSTLQAVHPSEFAMVMPASAAASPAPASVAARPMPGVMMRMAPGIATAGTGGAADPSPRAWQQPSTSPQAPSAALQMTPILTRSAALSTFVSNLPAQPVSSSNFNLSFDYCVANVSRAWLSPTFLQAPRWYLLGEQSGSRGGGKYESKAYRFAFLPAALVVLKNLIISAQWSEEDRTYAQSAASLGPFALVDKSFEGESLKSPGMQIFAWLCQVMPALPPVADPALSTSTGASPSPTPAPPSTTTSSPAADEMKQCPRCGQTIAQGYIVKPMGPGFLLYSPACGFTKYRLA